VRLVRQVCTVTTVAFEDAAVADYFDEMVDRGLRPECFARVWLHTHPGSSAAPSWTDEETLERCFGRADWAVMGILARGGARFARLQFHTGPGGALELPVSVDYSRPFPAADPERWEAEYLAQVQPELSSPRGLRWIEPLAADVSSSIGPWSDLRWGDRDQTIEDRSLLRDDF
jgi:hypothetical protein